MYGWAIAADSAIYTTAVTEVAEPEQLGSTMAMQSFLGFMGGVVGPIVVGGVLDLVPVSIEWGAAFSRHRPAGGGGGGGATAGARGARGCTIQVCTTQMRVGYKSNLSCGEAGKR